LAHCLKELCKIGAGAQVYIVAKMHYSGLCTVGAELPLDGYRRAHAQTAISILRAG